MLEVHDLADRLTAFVKAHDVRTSKAIKQTIDDLYRLRVPYSTTLEAYQQEIERLRKFSSTPAAIERRLQLELGLKAHQIALDGEIPQAMSETVQVEDPIHRFRPPTDWGTVRDVSTQGDGLLTVFTYTHLGSDLPEKAGNRITRLNIVIQQPPSLPGMGYIMRTKGPDNSYAADAIRINIDPLSPDFGMCYEPYMSTTFGDRKTIVGPSDLPFANDGETYIYTQRLANTLVDVLETTLMPQAAQPVAQTA